jgi:DNA-binding MarR family transcriptional regulator
MGESILQAINQKSFSSSFEKAVVNLLYTHNWYRDKYQAVYSAFGLKNQHYNVLRILKGSKPNPISPGEIKAVMLDKAPDLTRLLDKLVKMGLVDRHLCPENRRKMDVFITSKGLDVLEEITSKQYAMQGELEAGISADEAEQLSNLLDKLRN